MIEKYAGKDSQYLIKGETTNTNYFPLSKEPVLTKIAIIDASTGKEIDGIYFNDKKSDEHLSLEVDNVCKNIDLVLKNNPDVISKGV